MREGQCPKCGSQEVYSGVNVPLKSHGYGMNVVPIGGNLFTLSVAALDNYVCVNCGYVESYIADPQKLTEICTRWLKVRGGEM